MTLAAILVIAALLLWNFARGPEGKISIASIGMVMEDQSGEMDLLYRFIRQMPAIRGTCDIEKYSEHEAMEGLKCGDLNMVILIPENFMYDAEHMRDTQLKIYVPKGDILANDRVYAILSSVETLMVTTESAIIGMYEGMEYYEYNTTVADMENNLTDLYVEDFLNREDDFDIEYLSAYGNFSPFMYYGIFAVLLINLLMGAYMLSGYSENILETERLLAVDTYYRVKITILKILCFSVPFFVYGIFEYMVFHHACGLLDMEARISFPLIMTLLLISICFSAFVGMFATVVGNRQGNSGLYLLSVVLLWLLSLVSFGGIKVLPTSCCLFALLSAAFGNITAGPLLCVAAYIILFAGIMLLLRRKYDRTDGKNNSVGIPFRRNHSLYFKWFVLKLKQYLTGIVFWIEAAVLVLVVMTVYIMIQKSADTNLVAYVSSELTEEPGSGVLSSLSGGFDYYEVEEDDDLRSAVIKGEALAGINANGKKVKLYAPVGSYSAIFLRELLYPYILKAESPKMFGEYLSKLGLDDSEESYRAAYKANCRLLDNYDIDIFSIDEIDTGVSAKQKKADALVVCVMVFILFSCILNGAYEWKLYGGFLKIQSNSVRIALVIESGLLRGLLLAAVASIMILIIR